MSSSSSTNDVLKFAKLTENAFTPTRGSPKAAGLDLYSAYDATIPAHGKVLILKGGKLW
jgi:dUTP pyrophosphatase